MREKAVVCAAALVIIFLISAGLPAVAGQPAPEYTVKINRVVQIGGWGLAIVNDTITVHNNSTAVLNDVPVGLPRNLTAGLRYLGARDDQNRVLTVERDLESSGETYWIKVNFAQGLEYNKTYEFKVTSVFTGLLVALSEGFQYRFTTTPILRVKGTSENMTIIAGPQSKFLIPQELNLTQTAEGGPVFVRGYYAPIEPYTTRSIALNMTSSDQFIVRVPHAAREIRFDPDGRIHVSDIYDFENLAGSMTAIEITLPENSTDVMAYDAIGALWDSPREGPGISIGPRYREGFGQNKTFTFTLKYEVDPRTYLKQSEWWGGNQFKFPLLPKVSNWVIDKLNTTVIVPVGFNVRDASPSPSPSSTSGSTFYRNLQYEITDVTPYSDLELSLEYTYTPFSSGYLPILWVALVELVAVAIVVVTRTRKPPGLKIPVPSEKLRQFVELYDGRTALRLELDRMSEDLTRGALNKHEYRRRRKAIEMRMGELDRALQPLKQELKAFHPRYGEMMLGMEKAEAEIDANRLGEEHFRTQYRAGKISKEAYDRALSDLSKRVDKAREIIETSLVTLREEAR